METPNTPTVAYDAGYDDDHGAGTRCPEQRLWLAVLAQAGEDLRDRRTGVRGEAAEFFESDDLLQVLNYAGIDSDLAPWLRRRARKLAEASPEPRQPNGKLTYRGQTRSLEGWSEVTGISIYTLSHRLRRRWSIKRALTTPGRH